MVSFRSKASPSRCHMWRVRRGRTVPVGRFPLGLEGAQPCHRYASGTPTVGADGSDRLERRRPGDPKRFVEIGAGNPWPRDIPSSPSEEILTIRMILATYFFSPALTCRCLPAPVRTLPRRVSVFPRGVMDVCSWRVTWGKAPTFWVLEFKHLWLPRCHLQDDRRECRRGARARPYTRDSLLMNAARSSALLGERTGDGRKGHGCGCQIRLQAESARAAYQNCIGERRNSIGEQGALHNKVVPPHSEMPPPRRQ
jgi:hypothetical protein